MTSRQNMRGRWVTSTIGGDFLQTLTLHGGGRDLRLVGLSATIVLGALGVLVAYAIWRFYVSRQRARHDRMAHAATRDALEQSESRYRVLFERNPCPMWIYDHATTRILEVNEAAVLQYGYSVDEFTSMTLADLRDPGDFDRLEAELRSLAPDAKGVMHMARHRTKDGRTLDVEVRGHPLGIPGRQLRLVVATDITDRITAERELRAAEARAHENSQALQSLLDAAPQPMIVANLDGHVLHWNRAAEALFGWTKEEVLGREMPFAQERERLEILEYRRLLREGIVGRTYETVRSTKAGRQVQVLVAKARVDDHAGTPTGYIAVYTDLTERKQLEEQLRHAQKMEAVGTLAGGIAHDFNNVLTVIASYSGMLVADERYADARPDLEEIIAAARRATSLTRQLLTFSRKTIVRLESVEVNEIIDEMRPMLRRLLMEHVEIETRLAEEALFVSADATQIEQVIMNLVINAGDAMPDGGSLVVETQSVELDMVYAQAHAGIVPGAYVLLAVTDTGVGMDQATQAKIFEPFFTTKDVGRGTGLGLATVYAIVKSFGGHIWVYSEPGQGASFKIYFPRRDEEGTRVEPPVQVQATGFTGTVLLVEDDDAVRHATRRMLEKSGFSVLEAADGRAGLSVAASYAGKIDIVVTDLMMPRMNGGDFARELAKSYPDLRVVFTSGYTDDAVTRRGLVDAVHTFIQKPFTGNQLVQVVASLLNEPVE